MRSTTNVRVILLSIMVLALLVSISSATSKKDDKPADTAAIPDIKETVKVSWPEEDDFILSFHQDDSLHWVRLYYPRGQTNYKWQERGWVEYLQRRTGHVNLAGTAREKFLDARQLCPDATWDIISKSGREAKYPYIIFEIKCPAYNAKEPPDIQVWKMISGKTGIFVVEWTYRGEEIPKDRKEQILEVLNDAEIEIVPEKKG